MVLSSIAGRSSSLARKKRSSGTLYYRPTIIVVSVKAMTAFDVQMAQESHLDAIVDIGHFRSCLVETGNHERTTIETADASSKT